MTSSGSTPLPSDLRHLSALTRRGRVRGTSTVSNGSLSGLLHAGEHHPGMTQKRDYIVTCDQGAGRMDNSRLRSALSVSGQPRVENGESAEENQVSSTSSGSLMDMGSVPHFAHLSGAASLRYGYLVRSRRSTTRGCGVPTRADGRCTSRGYSRANGNRLFQNASARTLSRRP